MLTGKTALITGSTSGIGLGIAQALAQQGANILLNGFGEVDAARATISKLGTKVAYHAADMSQPQEIEAMMAFAQTTFGEIDIVVNNAGIQHVASIEDFPVERWNAIIAINLSSAFHTTRLALPSMRKKNWGRIINIASVHGLVASAQKAGYVAAKHGLIGLTKTVALDTAQTGITCNAICPGWVLTPLVQKQIDERAKSSNITSAQAEKALLLEKQPGGKFITVAQIGALTSFLCSNNADQIRGSTITMDGGWTAQ